MMDSATESRTPPANMITISKLNNEVKTKTAVQSDNQAIEFNAYGLWKLKMQHERRGRRRTLFRVKGFIRQKRLGTSDPPACVYTVRSCLYMCLHKSLINNK